MRFDERLPRGLAFPIASRFDAMFLEHVAHRLVTDVITDVRQRTLDSVVTPVRVFLGKAKDQIYDNLPDSWPADAFPIPAVIPFLGDQHPVPPQDRIRREQRADFFESLATEDLAFDRQSTPLIIVQQDAFLAELLFEDLVFGSQVFNHFLLLAIDPTSEDDDIKLLRLKYDIHDRSIVIQGMEMAFTIR